ncbi:hypothetical protein U1Q18_013537 [Sarracenia purpurea var. burkii]
MKNLREEAKESYGENVDHLLTPEMMFIDGCFILEFLYQYHHIEYVDKDPHAGAAGSLGPTALATESPMGRMNVVKSPTPTRAPELCGSTPVKPPLDRMEVVVQSNKSNAPVVPTNRAPEKVDAREAALG